MSSFSQKLESQLLTCLLCLALALLLLCLEAQELTVGILPCSKDVASQRQVHSSPRLRVMGVQQGGAQVPVNLLQLQEMLWGEGTGMREVQSCPVYLKGKPASCGPIP